MQYDATNDQLITISIDNTLRYTPCNGTTFTPEDSIALNSQPSSLSFVDSTEYIVIGCEESINLVKGKKILDSKKWNKEAFPVRVSLSCNNQVAVTGVHTAVGGVEKHEVEMFQVIDDKIVPNTDVPKLTGFKHIAELQYSPDGTRLAVANQKEVRIYEVASNYENPKVMSGISTRVTGMAWAPDNRHLATFSIDSSITIWDAVEGKNIAQISNSHAKANVSDLAWLKDDVVVSVGSDCAVSQWKITF